MKIGIFSTFIEKDALELVRAMQDSVIKGDIPDSEIAFIFSNREVGESPVTDEILDRLAQRDVSLISFSAANFKPDLRQTAREEGRKGNTSPLREWRNEFGEEVLRRLSPTDIDFLLGDMFIWGDSLCAGRNGINLHPALPSGPKGEWYRVIWELISNGASESGVMMHRVIPELDAGQAVAYCRFSIRGYQFDSLWQQLPENEEEFARIVKQGLSEREKTTHPLHRKIREHGLTREFPLIIQTAKSFAEGAIRISGESVVDRSGNEFREGYDVTSQIDRIVRPRLEGNAFQGKEKL